MSDTGKPFDPFDMVRGVLDTSLAAAAPLREMLEKTVRQAIEEIGLPSRADVARLAERLAEIESRLDTVDAKLDSLLSARKPGKRKPTSPARRSR
jgi:hypothetical protein